MNQASRTLPYITHPLQGIGGDIKSQPEDFRVEEIPAYEPGGEGEFLFVKLRKRDLTTSETLTRLASHCGLSKRETSAAGLKDRHAVTIQTVCLPAAAEEKLGSFRDPNVEILSSRKHRNKLKTGHLRGNRFDILLRNTDRSLDRRAFELRDLILEKGFPNYYGDQRFGRDRETLTTGIELLQGKNPLRTTPYSKRRFLQRLALSAVQSELFNRCLARRLKDGKLQHVLRGDVMQVVKSGGVFVVEDHLDDEQERFNRGATVTTGPMFGPKMKSPTDEPLFREDTVLLESGLTRSDFRRFKKLTSGTRRPYLIRLTDLQIERQQEGLRFRFELPKGAYATVLMQEFTRQQD